MSRHQTDFDQAIDQATTDLEQRPGHTEDAMGPRDVFIQDQNCCCLCGDQLRFDHQIDFLQLTVIESAECGACKIKLRKRLFTLN